jgi:hypothetical protein
MATRWIKRGGGKDATYVRTLTGREYDRFKLTGELPPVRGVPDNQPETQDEEIYD